MSEISLQVRDLLRSGWHELTRRPEHQIQALDGLRAMAVLLVIADHFSVTTWRDEAVGETWLTQLPFVHFGWTGVDLFFILSGFLIGKQLWQERARSGSINFPRFFSRRAFRIWPLYFVTLAMLAAGLGGVQAGWHDWLLVSNYFPTHYARSWSLSTEEMFYLLVPLAVALAPRLSLKSAALAAIALVLAQDATRMVSYLQLRASGVDPGDIALRLYSPFHLHSQALLVGLFLSFVAVHHPALLRRDAGKLSRHGLVVFILGVVAGFGWRSMNDVVFSFTALALIYGALTYFLLRDDSLVAKVFGARVLYPLSRLSYGMYLNHLVFGSAIIVPVVGALTGSRVTPDWVFMVGLVVTIAVSALVATVTFLVVEHPFLLLRSRWATGRPSGPASVVGLAPHAGATGT